MSYWIFVIRDDDSVFDNRIKQKKWPLFQSTKFRTCLEIGDNIIFYKAGKNAQIFLGSAVIKNPGEEISGKMVYNADLEEIDIWKKQPSIRNLIKNLRFIKNKEHWGLNLQGGIIEVDDKDYSLILKESKKVNRRK